MVTEYELTFVDYWSIIRRRAPYLIGTFVGVLTVAIVVAFAIPPTYRSTGTIMVESQQVSENIVPSAIRNQLDERINVIKQRVMTRDNLLKIAKKYDLFKGDSRSLATSELIDKLRDRIVIESINSGDAINTNRQGQPTVSFTLAFEDQNPDVALQITNDLITLFLNWNIKLRTEGAMDTTAFLTQESETLKKEVERLEAQIGAYKQENRNALPEQLTLRMTMMARAENDLREVERDYRSTKEELRSLEVELAAAKHGTNLETTGQSLPTLKAELARLSGIYKDTHPDIKRLKRNIEALEKSPNSSEADTTPSHVSNLAAYRIQARIDSDNARLSSLAQQRAMLQGKITENEHAMIMTPKVEQGLEVLIRDRDSAQKKYEELHSKKMNAQIAQNLESENKSERFSVLEPPVLPEKPFKPNRVKIFVLGFFLAVVSSGGAIMLLESIDKRIRGVEAFAHVLGYRPLVSIPYFRNQDEILRFKRLKMFVFWGVILAVVTVVVALHFLYMPLDVLFVRVLARLM